MSVGAVVKKDFQDGIRSKLLWVLMALFLLTIGGFSYLATGSAPSNEGDIAIIGFMGISVILAIIFLIPVTGLVVSIKSIVRERELGSIKILLSLPHTRGEIILGKFLGRSGLLIAAILSGFLPAGILFMARVDDFPLVEYFTFLFVMILFGIVFVAVGIGASSFTKTETRATVLGIAVFVLLYTWSTIFGYLNDQLDLLSGDALLFVQRFHLFWVFYDALIALLSLRIGDVPAGSVVTYSQFELGDTSTAASLPSQPFYLEHWFAFVILAIWIAVPLAVGYFRFERADL